jgi:hypothetical protein
VDTPVDLIGLAAEAWTLLSEQAAVLHGASLTDSDESERHWLVEVETWRQRYHLAVEQGPPDMWAMPAPPPDDVAAIVDARRVYWERSRINTTRWTNADSGQTKLFREIVYQYGPVRVGWRRGEEPA